MLTSHPPSLPRPCLIPSIQTPLALHRSSCVLWPPHRHVTLPFTVGQVRDLEEAIVENETEQAGYQDELHENERLNRDIASHLDSALHQGSYGGFSNILSTFRVQALQLQARPRDACSCLRCATCWASLGLSVVRRGLHCNEGLPH